LEPAAEGALMGAGAAIAAQLFTSVVQGVLQQRTFARSDAGARRQVTALVSRLGEFVYQCRSEAPVDWEKMQPALDRMLTHIYVAEVTTALTDAQANALYAAAGSIEVAFQFTSQAPSGDGKAAFNDSCERLAAFWDAMGHSTEAKRFRTIAQPAKSSD
jgi:ketosteroid isomerase-like protein